MAARPGPVLVKHAKAGLDRAERIRAGDRSAIAVGLQHARLRLWSRQARDVDSQPLTGCELPRSSGAALGLEPRE